MNDTTRTSKTAQERPALDSETWPWSHAEHLARYLYATSFVNGRRVVDAGTASGYGAATLKQAGALSVQAVDMDEASIREARRRYQVEGLAFILDDCETLSEIQGPIDVICSFENIEHLHHPGKVHQRP